jgi:hypothetical protein
MDNESLENLLEKIAIINQKYEEMAKISGENFNVFSILNLTTNEVRTHSAFIAELLNPKGKHGLGNAFLKEFVDIIKRKLQQASMEGSLPKFEFVPEECTKVAVEYWLGSKTESTGGYIDILLTGTGNNHLIIENKINAGDQKNQLLRYHSFNENAPLIYLTLNGKAPSDWSTGKDENVLQNILCISYRDEIYQWLETCHKIAVNHPLLRETIKQYLNLIKILTHQTMETKEREEIIKEIAKSESQMKALQHLFEGNIWPEMRKHQMEELGKNLHSLNLRQNNAELNKDRDVFEFKSWTLTAKPEEQIPFGNPDYDFCFYKPEWKYVIFFQFGAEFSQLHYGIDVPPGYVTKNASPDAAKVFANALNQIGVRIEDPDWIWKTKLYEFDEISWYDKPTKGLELIIDKVNKITELAGNLMSS